MNVDKINIRQDISNCFGGAPSIPSPSTPAPSPSTPSHSTPAPSPSNNENDENDENWIEGVDNETVKKYSIITVIVFMMICCCCSSFIMMI